MRVYNFPMLEIGNMYNSLEEAVNSIGDLAYNAGCEGMERLFEQSNADSRPVVTLKCRLCDANIKFLEVGRNYLLQENKSRHEHPSDQLSEAETRYMSLFGF